jgi:beta-glucosidase
MTAGPQTEQPAVRPAGFRPAGRAAAPSERDLVATLPLAAKVRLLTGADGWRTARSEAIGLRAMVTSDGPAGVRGTTKDERKPSASLPCPSALGATWDTELVYELAGALGTEARSKGVDVLLGPTVNLMRTPLGGRGFECFAEDPVLTARLASAYVRGVQDAGVAATVKHYVGNDSETHRWTYDSRISLNVLRELYLIPFEACVREAGALLVMAAYNSVNGSRMTENRYLLRDVLKNEWGFDGVVISDWHAGRSTTATAIATLDLCMPGPDGPWGELLQRAVGDGSVTQELVDDKVIRLLSVARRVGALSTRAASDRQATATQPNSDSQATATQPNGDGHVAATPEMATARLVDPALLRRSAAASFVLLRNQAQALPLDPASVASIAVSGPNASQPTIQGGGSAGVAAAGTSVPADALRAALAGKANVSVSAGCQTWAMVPEPPAGSLHDPVTGEPGIRLEFTDDQGALISAEHRTSASLAWWDGVPAGIGWGEPGRIVLAARFRPTVAGQHVLGAAGVGRLTLAVDGVPELDGVNSVPADPVEAMTRPGELRAGLWLEPGTDVDLRLEYLPAADGAGPLTVRLGIVPQAQDDVLLAAAEAAAACADAAVVVVGSAELSESEGFDRSTLALPGRQDELVRRVAAVNQRTVVVVNAGMPVLMPWAGQVAAIVYAWLPGQEFGSALADVLLGRAEPGGRLPVSMPVTEADCPVLHAVPEQDGTLPYAEGLLVGYRGYDASGVAPLYPFGHGLGYTTWAYESLRCPPAVAEGGGPEHTAVAEGAGPEHTVAGSLELTVTVRNTGARPGKEVVQAYLAGPGQPSAGRPVRVLAAFAAVRAAPGEAVQARLRIPARAFARYDESLATWIWPAGEYTVHVGRSSRDLPLSARVRQGG